MTQLHPFVDERAIGLPISTLPTQINRVARVAFDSAALYISDMGIATSDASHPVNRQRELARALIADPEIVDGIDRALASGKGTVVFAEQHLAALARLAVKHADRWRPADLDTRFAHARAGAPWLLGARDERYGTAFRRAHRRVRCRGVPSAQRCVLPARAAA